LIARDYDRLAAEMRATDENVRNRIVTALRELIDAQRAWTAQAEDHSQLVRVTNPGKAAANTPVASGAEAIAHDARSVLRKEIKLPSPHFRQRDFSDDEQARVRLLRGQRGDKPQAA
jgi:hypothetical protein